MLQVTIETIAGCDHQFFFAGDLKDLNNVLGSKPVPCCDKFGEPTKKSKAFNSTNINVITIVEVEPEVKSSEVDELAKQGMLETINEFARTHSLDNLKQTLEAPLATIYVEGDNGVFAV